MAKSSGHPSWVGRKPASRAVSVESSGIGIRYIESSALVAALLEHDAEALKSFRAQTLRITSALTLAETARAIVRARVGERLTPNAERAAIRALRWAMARSVFVAMGHGCRL